MNKTDLRNKILASREALEGAFGRISEAQMSLIILHGDWSVKDLIGHLGFWENRVVILYEILSAGNIPEPMQDFDILNSQAVLEMRKLSLAKVKSIELSAFQKVLAIVNDANDSELFKPDHYAWTKGRCFEEIISDNTWGHYDEHLPELVAWLKRIA
jgi:hypothetical protein